MLGFNDTPALVGHFVSSHRESEKKEELVKEVKEGGRDEREETEEIKKIFPSTLTRYKDRNPCTTVSQYQLDAPVT